MSMNRDKCDFMLESHLHFAVLCKIQLQDIAYLQQSYNSEII